MHNTIKCPKYFAAKVGISPENAAEGNRLETLAGDQVELIQEATDGLGLNSNTMEILLALKIQHEPVRQLNYAKKSTEGHKELKAGMIPSVEKIQELTAAYQAKAKTLEATTWPVNARLIASKAHVYSKWTGDQQGQYTSTKFNK